MIITTTLKRYEYFCKAHLGRHIDILKLRVNTFLYWDKALEGFYFEGQLMFLVCQVFIKTLLLHSTCSLHCSAPVRKQGGVWKWLLFPTARLSSSTTVIIYTELCAQTHTKRSHVLAHPCTQKHTAYASQCLFAKTLPFPTSTDTHTCIRPLRGWGSERAVGCTAVMVCVYDRSYSLINDDLEEKKCVSVCDGEMDGERCFCCHALIIIKKKIFH